MDLPRLPPPPVPPGSPVSPARATALQSYLDELDRWCDALVAATGSLDAAARRTGASPEATGLVVLVALAHAVSRRRDELRLCWQHGPVDGATLSRATALAWASLDDPVAGPWPFSLADAGVLAVALADRTAAALSPRADAVHHDVDPPRPVTPAPAPTHTPPAAAAPTGGAHLPDAPSDAEVLAALRAELAHDRLDAHRRGLLPDREVDRRHDAARTELDKVPCDLGVAAQLVRRHRSALDAAAPAGTARPDPRPGTWVAEVWVDPAWMARREPGTPCPVVGHPLVVPLEATSVTLGRTGAAPAATVPVDDALVNGHAATLTLANQAWSVEVPAASEVFTATPGRPLPSTPLAPSHRHTLAPGEHLLLGGRTRVVLRRTAPPAHT